MKLIKVLWIKPKGTPEVEILCNTLEAFQNFVGGRIECHNIFCGDAPEMGPMAVICDEEGVLKEKPYTCRIKLNGDFPVSFCGDIIVAGVEEDEFCDISDKQIVKLLWDLVVRP